MRLSQHTARGSILLEGLIAVLIFAVGILAFVALQATAVRDTDEAKYRASASFLANQIIGRMWVDRANLAQYAHRSTGVPCAPTGGKSTNANVTVWLDNVQRTLPNALETSQQIIIGADNLVTVAVCWQRGDIPAHNLVVTAQIQG